MSQTNEGGVHRQVDLAPGFHFVSTPIGTARDITLRALDILASADVIAAEDTRTTRHLMDMHGVPLRGRPLIAYHDHSGPAQRSRLLEMVGDGKSVAYASEAGTPLVADPGYQLGHAAIDAGLLVTAAPGPSAVLTALTISGLPTDRFLFAGFAPASGGSRRKWMERLALADATLVLFESPKRINRLLGDLVQHLGADREAAICRELTKRFEEAIRGTLGELAERCAGTSLKGEIVLVIDRAKAGDVDEESVVEALRDALKNGPVKQAAAEVAELYGIGKRDAYQIALRLKKESGDQD